MTEHGDSRQNHLLNALSMEEYERLLPNLERIELSLSKVLYESGGPLRFAYFPTTCIVSLLYVLENGASAEIAVVGNDGLIGVALFMGGGSMPNRAVVQSAGCRLTRLFDKGIKRKTLVRKCFIVHITLSTIC